MTSVSDAGSVVRNAAAAAIDGVGVGSASSVEGVGSVDEVAAAVAIVKCDGGEGDAVDVGSLVVAGGGTGIGGVGGDLAVAAATFDDGVGVGGVGAVKGRGVCLTLKRTGLQHRVGTS